MKSPQISIVVPVYNAEKYLEQCIKSIINQDISFEDNIEIVLIDDGSVDESGAVCKKFQDTYPDNIQYIKQKNAGASTARNVGIDNAKGEFIGFVDADDYLSRDSLGAILKFFSEAPGDVDAAVIRVVQVGVATGERSINRKFENGTRVVDLKDSEWFDISPRVAPAFIRSFVAKKYRFKSDVRVYEDSRYMGEVLSENLKLGVVSRGTYFNRKHNNYDKNASITTGASAEKHFYTDSPEKVSLYLLEKMSDKTGRVLKYYQHLVLYEMSWRVFYNQNVPSEVLSKAEYDKYKKVNKKILSYIEDGTIVGYEGYHPWQRLYLLCLKHQKNILKEADLNDEDELVWSGHVLFNYEKFMQTMLTDCYVMNDTLVLKGFFIDFADEKIEVFVRTNNGHREKIKLSPNALDPTLYPMEFDLYKRAEFVVRIPIKNKKLNKIHFTYKINNRERKIAYLFPAIHVRLPRYSWDRKYIYAQGLSQLTVARSTFRNRVVVKVLGKKKYFINIAKGRVRRIVNSGAKNPMDRLILQLVDRMRARLVK